MLVLIDENVLHAAAVFLRERRHDVRMLAELISAIIVTMDRDFKRLVQRYSRGVGVPFRRLGRVNLDCTSEHCRTRLEKLIRSIKFEAGEVIHHGDRCLIIEITETSFRVMR